MKGVYAANPTVRDGSEIADEYDESQGRRWYVQRYTSDGGLISIHHCPWFASREEARKAAREMVNG